MNNLEAPGNDTYSTTEPSGWDSLEAALDQEKSAELESLMNRFGVSEPSAQFILDKFGSDVHAGGMGFHEEHPGQAAGAPNGLLGEVYDKNARKYHNYSSGSMALSNEVMHRADYGSNQATLTLDEVRMAVPWVSGEDALQTAIHAASINSDETKVPLATGTERISGLNGSENSIALTKMFMKRRSYDQILVVESLCERGPSMEAEDGAWQNGEVIDGSVTTRPATIEEIRAIQNGNLGQRYL